MHTCVYMGAYKLEGILLLKLWESLFQKISVRRHYNEIAAILLVKLINNIYSHNS